MQHIITLHVEHNDYESLINYAGQDNIERFILDTLKPHISLIKTLKNNQNAVHNKNNFDEFFGLLTSQKSVSIDEMNQVIKQRGGQL